MFPDFTNLREYPRYTAELTVTLNHNRWVHPIQVKSKDISLGGLFVYTRYTKDLPHSMVLAITIPTADERFVTFDGEVVHSIPGVGVGIRFLTKSRHLNLLLAKIKRGSPERPDFSGMK
ncbi:PilZ domain-containing protein [Myxococcota bacterium]|nr:PilZ domain-containing protein [Myxococcota bacterium]MBU1379934.1 PilZ domain-containing protein [Myxococcota bacterium]MBU1498572.1 PilZ domain-containing protein [Myxococcota bacterium]